jgi:hypothetical protein
MKICWTGIGWEEVIADDDMGFYLQVTVFSRNYSYKWIKLNDNSLYENYIQKKVTIITLLI